MNDMANLRIAILSTMAGLLTIAAGAGPARKAPPSSVARESGGGTPPKMSLEPCKVQGVEREVR